MNSDTADALVTLAGIACVFALLAFFFIELTNPELIVPDRTLYILLGLIATLLGLDTLRSDDGGGGGEGGIGGSFRP